MSAQQQVQGMEAFAKNDGNINDAWLANDQKSVVRANGYAFDLMTASLATVRVQYSCASDFFIYWINNVRQPNRKTFIARLEALLA